MGNTKTPVKVFVSYAKRDETKDEVGRLVEWLNEQEGIEVISDHPCANRPPKQGWQAWMMQSIEDADAVLCICGENFKKGFEKRDGSKGVTYEGSIVTVDLYEGGGSNVKYFPILPEAGKHDVVPKPLKQWDNGIALVDRERILALIKDEPVAGKSITVRPKFRDLNRETLGRSAPSSSIFLRLRFADRAIDYVKLDEVEQAFNGFYTSQDVFSWWLIVGSAGTGKSRTALEFCKKLENDGWDAGFLSLKDTPPESELWETWCPEKDTLLVIDYVAQEFSGNPRSITEIFTRLSRRAEQNTLGDKRLRILLLEREYKERSEAGQPLEWYRQLDKTTIYQPPFDLNTVSNEGLYSIATETAEKIWKSPKQLPANQAFLDELEKLDKKKRPLFAMLLAGYRAGVDPKTEIAKNEVLDYTIEHELERSLFPAGVKRDPDLLKALLLSTCTGGKLGAVELPHDHPLWDSGLGEETDKDCFRFHPLEPDLLGERFVLNCDSRNNPFHIGRKQLEELLEACWQDAPFETAYFFSRCAQDFATSDSEKIADLFLSAMTAIKDSFLSRWVWLRSLVDLSALLEPAEGERIWQEAAELGDTLEIRLRRAEAALNMILGYIKAGDLRAAQELFDGMAGLGDTPEIAEVRTYAVALLIIGYSKAGDLRTAQDLFNGMDGLDYTPKIAELRAQAVTILIIGYSKAGDLRTAQDLFNGMAGLGDTPEIAELRAAAEKVILDATKQAHPAMP